jgi:hypothetical protein
MTVSTALIAKSLGISRKAALERAKKEDWLFLRVPGGFRWAEYRLPLDVRLALANAAPPPGKTYRQAAEKERSAAAARGILVTEWKGSGLRKEDYVAAYNAGGIDTALFGEPGPVSLRTFYRWV